MLEQALAALEMYRRCYADLYWGDAIKRRGDQVVFS
jgi:hypothetical protein